MPLLQTYATVISALLLWIMSAHVADVSSQACDDLSDKFTVDVTPGLNLHGPFELDSSDYIIRLNKARDCSSLMVTQSMLSINAVEEGGVMADFHPLIGNATHCVKGANPASEYFGNFQFLLHDGLDQTTAFIPFHDLFATFPATADDEVFLYVNTSQSDLAGSFDLTTHCLTPPTCNNCDICEASSDGGSIGFYFGGDNACQNDSALNLDVKPGCYSYSASIPLQQNDDDTHSFTGVVHLNSASDCSGLTVSLRAEVSGVEITEHYTAKFELSPRIADKTQCVIGDTSSYTGYSPRPSWTMGMNLQNILSQMPNSTDVFLDGSLKFLGLNASSISVSLNFVVDCKVPPPPTTTPAPTTTSAASPTPAPQNTTAPTPAPKTTINATAPTPLSTPKITTPTDKHEPDSAAAEIASGTFMTTIAASSVLFSLVW